MTRRRRPRAGAAGSGSASASSGIVPMAHPGPGRPVPGPCELVPMAPASEGSGSTGEMMQTMAAAASSGAAPMVHPEKGAAGTAWIQDNPNKKGATASSGGVPTVHPLKGSAGTVTSGEMLDKMAAGTAWIQDNPNKKAATASSGGVPTVHPGKGSAGTVTSGEMLDKMAATVGLAQMVHPGKLAAGSGSGSTGDMLQKKADVGSSRGAPMTCPGKGATTSVSSGGMLQKKTPAAAARSRSTGDMLQKKAAVASSGGTRMTHPGKGKVATTSVSSGGILQKKTPAAAARLGLTGDMLPKKAAVASSGGTPMTHPGKGKVVASSVSSGGMLQKKVAAASVGGMPTTLLGKGAVDTGLSQEMPPKKAMALSGDSPTLGALDRNTTAQDCEESVAKHSINKALTPPTAKIPQKHCTEIKADMGLSGGMPQKQISKVETDTGLSEKMLHEHLTKEADTAKNMQESGSNEIVHVSEEDTETKEAEDLIKKLNELRIGEPISEQESLDYLNNLACHPPRIDLKVHMKNEELAKQHDRHALCRLRYYKDKLQQASKEELCGDKLKSILDISEDDCNKEFIKKERYFRRFEKDKAFDWFFHPDYLCCSLLVDYQRLVLKNHGYSRWSEYHTYLHSYEIEQEYVNYCEELSKQLKWMEPYVDIDHSSVKWDKISSRAALQAIKIAATSFDKITVCLAFNAYYECNESMGYDVWFKESNVFYFEIWRRVTEGMSFKKALEEVYNLNRFPLCQPMMKAALEFDETMEMMEDEFLTCTEDITPEVKEDKAKELIAEAVSKRDKKPKSYEQYIRKKIDIARIIGIL